MHKIYLVNRLKKSEPHSTAHYQAELEQQLVQHNDVIDKSTGLTEDRWLIQEDIGPTNARLTNCIWWHPAVSRAVWSQNNSFQGPHWSWPPGKTALLIRYVPHFTITCTHYIWFCCMQAYSYIQAHTSSCTITTIWISKPRFIQLIT